MFPLSSQRQTPVQQQRQKRYRISIHTTPAYYRCLINPQQILTTVEQYLVLISSVGNMVRYYTDACQKYYRAGQAMTRPGDFPNLVLSVFILCVLIPKLEF